MAHSCTWQQPRVGITLQKVRFFFPKYLDTYMKSKNLVLASLKHYFFVQFLIYTAALLLHHSYWILSKEGQPGPVMFWVLVQPELVGRKGNPSAEMQNYLKISSCSCKWTKTLKHRVSYISNSPTYFLRIDFCLMLYY